MDRYSTMRRTGPPLGWSAPGFAVNSCQARASSRPVLRGFDGDRVLIAEACTHHRVEDDIGTVKIPRWLRQKVGGELHFDWSSGLEMPAELGQYKLIIHCGACMINRKEMLHRIIQATSAGVPVVNYGVLIASLHGILRRALSPFPGALRLLEESKTGVNECAQGLCGCAGTGC